MHSELMNRRLAIIRDSACRALTLASLSLSLEAAEFLPSPIPREDFWTTDGPVYSLLATNGVLYVGGYFNQLLPGGRGLGGLFDAYSGVAEADFPKANGAIQTVALDGAGGWFLGGRVHRGRWFRPHESGAYSQ